MAQLPLFKDPNQQLMLLQTRWKSLIDPVLASPFSNGNLINNVSLIVGSTNINHGLQRMQQGWILTDSYGPSPYSVCRALPFNNTTLTLQCNAAVTVSVWCF